MVSVEEVQEVAQAPSGHMRAPGDEEDYETPQRPLKRCKFEEDGEDEEEPDNSRRVKWDKGLQTTVYLDDTPPHPRRPKDDVIKKGCLASSAKVRVLDPIPDVRCHGLHC